MDWAEAIIREVMKENGYAISDEKVADMATELRNSSIAERLYGSVFEFVSSEAE